MQYLEEGKFFDYNEFVNSSMSFGSLCLFQEQVNKEIVSLNSIAKNMLSKLDSYTKPSLYRTANYKKMNSVFLEIDENDFFTFDEKQAIRSAIAKIYCFTILAGWLNIKIGKKTSINSIFPRIDDVKGVINDFLSNSYKGNDGNLLLMLLEIMLNSSKKGNLFMDCSEIVNSIFSSVSHFTDHGYVVDFSDVYKKIDNFVEKYQSEAEREVDVLEVNYNNVYKKIRNYYATKIRYYELMLELIELMKQLRKNNSLDQIMLLRLRDRLDLLKFDFSIIKKIMSNFQLEERAEQVSKEKIDRVALEKKVIIKTPKEVFLDRFDDIERRILRLRRLMDSQFKVNLYQIEKEFNGRKKELEDARYLSDDDVELYNMFLDELDGQLKTLEEGCIIPKTIKTENYVTAKAFVLFDVDKEMKPYICDDMISSFIDNNVNLELGYEDFNKLINDLISSGEMEIISSNISSVSDVTHYCMLPVYYDKTQRTASNATGLIRLKPRKNSDLRFVCREFILKKDSEIYSQVVTLLSRMFSNMKIDLNEDFKFIMNFAAGLKNSNEAIYSESIKRYKNSYLKKLLLDDRENVKQRLNEDEIGILEDIIKATLEGYNKLQAMVEEFDFNIIDSLTGSNSKKNGPIRRMTF